MFIIELKYKASLAAIDGAMRSHIAYLNEFRVSQRADDLDARIRKD